MRYNNIIKKKNNPKGGRKTMNTYEVVNLRGEMKTLHGTSGLDALLRAGLNPKEWATIRATLGI